MKQSYTDYLNELSGNRMDILEELISTKYKKFRKFYKIMSRYSKDIAHIAYRFSDNDSLDIDITINPDVNLDKFVKKINNEAGETYQIDISSETKVIYMSIIRVD